MKAYKTPLQDERITQARYKIQSELMLVIFYIAVISFCIKALYFQMDLKQCATEYLILIVSPLYQTFRSRQLDVVLSTEVSRKALLPLAAMIALVAVMVWLRRSDVVLTASSLGYLGVFVVIFLVVQQLFVRSERKRAKKLEETYDDED